MVNPVEARRHIEEKWATYASSPVLVKEALEGALQTIQKGFSREGHFLYEFIQNADDKGARALQIILQDSQVVIRNDGQPFDSKDVDALCHVAHSNKSPEDYIGYLGVGFKSVFLISETPEIHSGQYHFAFRRKANPNDFPWQIAPIWLQDRRIAQPWQTEFVIPLLQSETSEKLSWEMTPETLNRRILLFLRGLSRLELVDETKGVHRIIEREELADGIFELQETLGTETIRERWRLFHSGSVPVPDNIRADWFTQNWNRDAAVHRAVTIAFKLEEDGSLEPVPGTVHMGVFSYLPLREETTRLKFLVHTDFLTSIGRTRIQDEAPWNLWLAEKVLELIIDTATTLLADGQMRKRALEVLWPARTEHNDFFANQVERDLIDYLTIAVELPTYDGMSVKPSDGLYVADEDMWDVVGPVVLERLYARKPLARDLTVPVGSGLTYQTPNLFGNSTSDDAGFVSSREGQSLLIEKGEELDVAFFKLLYQRMAAWGVAQSTYLRAPLARASIVLAEDGTVGTREQVFFKPERISAPAEQKFKFVHPALVADQFSRGFLEMIGVAEVSPIDVNRAIAEQVVPQARDIWSFLTDEQKLDWLASFKDLIEQGAIVSAEINGFVTLPSKNSPKWLAPGELLFPNEYSPEHNVEPLITAGLLQDGSIVFVDPDIGGSENRESWKRFLEQLGVGGLATERNRLNGWTAQVGVGLARKYEIKHAREDIHEVTEAERGVSDPGYDLRTREKVYPTAAYDRYIEAKGTRGPGSFELKPGSLKQIFGPDKDRFFVYVTTEALSSPRLNVIRAVDLNPELLLGVGDLQLELKNLPVSESISLENIG